MTDAIGRMRFRWTGEGFTPWRRYEAECDKLLVVGMDYTLQVYEERSDATHRHFFAAIKEGWRNLPEQYGDEFPTPEHLRKWCLIKANYCDRKTMVFDSPASAARALVFSRQLDEFAIIVQEGPALTLLTAKSQSVRTMGKAEFQASKTAVLDIIASMVNVTPEQLADNAGRSA